MKRIATIVFSIIFVGAGAGFAFIGILDLYKAGASTDWPFVQGEIVSSEIEQRRRNVGRRGHITTFTYYANILYEYSVDGTIFSGSRVGYGDFGTDNSTHATQVLSVYPTNKRINVYYMPQNPEESLLEPGVRPSTWFRLGFGLVFAAMGALLAYFLFRLRKN